MSDNNAYPELKTIFRKSPMLLTRHVQRGVFHLCCALFASSLVGKVSATSGEAPELFLSAYLGLICLFPPGIDKKFEWAFPSFWGVFQCTACVAMGLPFLLALFLGGCQTWTQRQIVRGGIKGRDLVMPLFLVSGLITLFWPGDNIALIAPIHGLIALLFAGVGALAQFFFYRCDNVAFFRFEFLSIDEKLIALIERIQKKWPETIIDALCKLRTQFATLPNDLPKMNKDVWTLAHRLESLVDRLPLMRDEESVLRAERFKILEDVIRRETAAIQAFIENASSKNRNDAAILVEKPRLPALSSDDLASFDLNIRQLRETTGEIPDHLQASALRICASAKAILECGVKQPNDIESVRKFLSRYLPAVLMVINEYRKLANQNNGYAEANAVLERSSETLSRLEIAFKEQRRNLLDNDIEALDAELKVLDKLLKIDGH